MPTYLAFHHISQDWFSVSEDECLTFSLPAAVDVHYHNVVFNFSQNHEPWDPETSCPWWPTWTAHRSSHQEADAPACPRDYPWVGETVFFFLNFFLWATYVSLLFHVFYDITAIFSKVRVFCGHTFWVQFVAEMSLTFLYFLCSPLSPRLPSTLSKPRYSPRKVSKVQNQKVAKVVTIVERAAKLCSKNQAKDMVGGVRAGRYHISIQDQIIPRLV